MKGLNPSQARFVRAYLVSLNATKAALEAGYSPATASSQGHRLLKHAQVQEAIAQGRTQQLEKLDLKAENILRELLRIGLSDPAEAFTKEGALKPIHDMPVELRRAISSVETDELWAPKVDENGREQIGVTRKIKFWDKNKALESLAKHLGLLRDKLELTGENGAPVSIEIVRTVTK